MDGKIYKIVSPSTDKIYIGSTVLPLSERLENHELIFQEWFSSEFVSSYCTSFEILKYGDYEIELIEKYPCDTYKELCKREGEHQIKNYINCVNTKIEGVSVCSKKIRTSGIFICYCGEKINNKYRDRYNHTRSDLHKQTIRNNHLQMIESNPVFNFIYV